MKRHGPSRLWLLILTTLPLLSGCATYKLCYEHPAYGKLCVEIDGREYVKKTMTSEEADALRLHEEHK